MADAGLQRRLKGQKDSRGPQGIMSRGKNVYMGASHSAHRGGGIQFGRPRTEAAQTPNVQPNLKGGGGGLPGNTGVAQMLQGMMGGGSNPMDFNPQPVNLMQAIQRRLLGGQGGN